MANSTLGIVLAIIGAIFLGIGVALGAFSNYLLDNSSASQQAMQTASAPVLLFIILAIVLFFLAGIAAFTDWLG